MKTIKLLFLLAAVLLFNNSFAQTPHLTLSDQYPQPGEKITLTYNADGTALEGKGAPTARIYYMDNKTYPAEDVTLKAAGNLWSGAVTIPDSAGVFVVKLSSADSVDNNAGKGYIYLVYKGKTPVQGAYAALAYTNVQARNLGIKTADIDVAADDMGKELALYPSGRTKYQPMYFLYLSMAQSPAHKALAVHLMDSLEKSSVEKDNYAVIGMLFNERKKAAADSLTAVLKAKYPNGIIARQDRENAIFSEKNTAKKDSLFDAYMKSGASKNSDYLDYIIANVATANLTDANFDKFNYYKAMLKDSTIVADELNTIPYNWAKAGSIYRRTGRY